VGDPVAHRETLMTWSQWPITWAQTNWPWAGEWELTEIVFSAAVPWCELRTPLVPGVAVAGHLVAGTTLVPAALVLPMPSTVTVALPFERAS